MTRFVTSVPIAMAAFVFGCSGTIVDDIGAAVPGSTLPAADASGGTGGSGGSVEPPEAAQGGQREAQGVAGGSNESGGVAEGAAGSTAPGLDPEIIGLVGGVSATAITARINTLSAFTTRNTCSSDVGAAGNDIGAARDFIKAQYEAIGGLTVSLDPFTAPACGTTVTRENVIAVKLGAHPDRVIVIGGHYDSRTVGGTDPTSAAPGANDSGSQTSLVLEAAQRMAGLDFDATILFASFAGEEQGLYGSAHLAKSYAGYVTPGAKVEAMLNNDIVGGDNTTNTGTMLQEFRLFSAGTPRETAADGKTDDTSPSRGLMRYVGTWGSAYVPSMTMLPQLRQDRPGRGGDQQSFLDQGIAAVRIMETAESLAHQHTPNDLATYITPDYEARLAQVVISVAANLARAPRAPALAGVTGTASGPFTLTFSAPLACTPVDHYVVAARPSTENFYKDRFVVAAGATSVTVTPSDLGMAGETSLYLSIAAVDASSHESLFAYPEYRCDASACTVPADALDVTR
jgi:hypothetical protein